MNVDGLLVGEIVCVVLMGLFVDGVFVVWLFVRGFLLHDIVITVCCVDCLLWGWLVGFVGLVGWLFCFVGWVVWLLVDWCWVFVIVLVD